MTAWDRSWRAALLAALLAAGASGCDGEDEAGATPPPAPSDLRAAQVPGEFDRVEVRWASPLQDADVEVQLRVDTGAWATQPYRIPASATTLQLSLSPDLPEASTLAFRARTIRGREASAWSVEATCPRGVRPAANLSIETRWSSWDGPTLHLGWSRRSLAADRVRLERQIRPAQGAPEPWVELPLEASATAYQDVKPPGWVDLARAAYRVTYLAGDHASDPVEVVSAPGGLATPCDLASVVTGSDVRLTWTNASTGATRLDATRWTAGGSDQRYWSLSPDATSLDDPGLAPGLHQYAVQAVAETAGLLSEPARVALVVPSPSFEATFPARALFLPLGSGAARGADGSFAIAQGTEPRTYPSSVFAPDGADWDRFSTPGEARMALPGPLIDGAGRVHAIYFEAVWSGATVAPIRHAWRDAAGWHVELIGLGRTSAPSAALAPDGSVHVAWELPDGQGLAYATNAGGAFTVEELRPAPGTNVSLASPLALDGAAPRILLAAPYGTPARTWLASRDDGGWTLEEIPDAASFPSGLGSLLTFGGEASWIYGLFEGDGFGLWLRERRGGAWGAAERLASTLTVPLPGIGAALSPDGTRIAVALPGRDFPYPTDVTRLLVRAGGAVTVTDLLPASVGAQVGFTPEGKIWLLDGLTLDAAAEGIGAYVLYEEP